MALSPSGGESGWHWLEVNGSFWTFAALHERTLWVDSGLSRTAAFDP